MGGLLFSILLAVPATAPAQSANAAHGDRDMRQTVDALLARMTLAEKVGQLSILGADRADLEAQVRAGLGGTNGVLPGRDVAAYTRRMQQLAMQSRLKIPLWFMGDVSHGFRTTFPIPLALAASWDPAMVSQVHRQAAREATAAGVDWTFSPMVDITRDPRWGRVAEGAGEDPFLGRAMALAQLQGFQGSDLSAPDTMLATAKHFVGYGAAEAGRDYNETYLSPGELDDVYLPPFHALVDAGIAAVMPSLSTLNDVPATADGALLDGLLRRQWGFKGLVVSDFDAVDELQQHGVAATPAAAARLALQAGVDIDLHSGTYLAQLPALVRDGQVSEASIDAAVRRVLEAKYRLGLFADPYRYGRAGTLPLARDLARRAARESMVLLKNDHDTLPLARPGRLAVIGPLADDRAAMLGQMPALGRAENVVTLLTGIREAAGGDASVSYTHGVDVDGDDSSGIAAAVEAARRADVAILVLGEDNNLIGEGHSRTMLGLPGQQLALAKAVVAAGRPVVVVLVNGRPLSTPWLATHAAAILEAWVPGDEAGHAVADLLFGRGNPSGKLPMSVPRSVGQVPLYYAHRQTGRPYDDSSELARHYSTHYVDSDNSPLYPFGFGLSYTRFAIDRVGTDHATLSPGGTLTVHARLRNLGDRDGTEVVQLYVRDRVASVSPPVRLLKGFRRVTLKAGASTDVDFTLRPEDLAFRRIDGHVGTEPGDYDVYIGSDATATAASRFTLTDH